MVILRTMVWVLIVGIIIIFVQVFVISLLFSCIVINIEECEISYNENKNNKFNIEKLKIRVQIYLFKFIKLLSINVNKDILAKIKYKLTIEEFQKLNDEQKRGVIFAIKNIRKLRVKIKTIDLDLDLGTENMLATTFLVPVISTALSTLITSNMEDENLGEKTNCKFKVTPKYINTNNFKLKGTSKIYFDTIRILFLFEKYEEAKAK